MFPTDWTPRSLLVAGSVFIAFAVTFIALGSIAGDPFALFVGITSVVPAAAMLVDGTRRGSKNARRAEPRERT
ncbi:hypothetical protein ACLBXX_14770 [Microbacterium sp. C23T]